MRCFVFRNSLCMVVSGCSRKYHHNYYVDQGTRYYYKPEDFNPKFVQVGKHQYVERALIDHWINHMIFNEFVLLLSAAYTSDTD